MNWKKCTTPNGMHDFPHSSLPCENCGLYQDELWKSKDAGDAAQQTFEDIKQREPVKGVNRSFQATAVELANKFGEPNKVGAYIGIVTRLGESRARMIAADVLEDSEYLRNPAAAFFSKCKKKEAAA